MSVYDESPGKRNREAFVGFLFFLAMVVLLGALLCSCGKPDHEYDAHESIMTVYGKGYDFREGHSLLYCTYGTSRVYLPVSDSVRDATPIGERIEIVVMEKIEKADESD